jgi:hypothetical protein
MLTFSGALDIVWDLFVEDGIITIDTGFSRDREIGRDLYGSQNVSREML